MAERDFFIGGVRFHGSETEEIRLRALHDQSRPVPVVAAHDVPAEAFEDTESHKKPHKKH